MVDSPEKQISFEQMVALLEGLTAQGDGASKEPFQDQTILKAICQTVRAAKQAAETNVSLTEEINTLRDEILDEVLEADARGRATGLLEAAQMIEDIEQERFHSVDQRQLVRQLRTFSRQQYPNKMLKCEECGLSLDACCDHASSH